MSQKPRGATLTILAILLALMALSNFGKTFTHHSGVGFVFFGMRLSGTANMIVAPIFGIIIAVYVYGILAMRKFALPLGIVYAAYLVPYPFVAIGVSSGAAWMLYRRRDDLA